VLRDRVVELELALIPELHDGRCRERLRDGGDAKERFRCRRDAPLPVGLTKASRPDEILIVNDPDGESRLPAVSHLRFGPRLEEPDPVRDLRRDR
jgi:hypothetical protein